MLKIIRTLFVILIFSLGTVNCHVVPHPRTQVQNQNVISKKTPKKKALTPLEISGMIVIVIGSIIIGTVVIFND